MRAMRTLLAAAGMAAMTVAAPVAAQMQMPGVEVGPGNTVLSVTGEGKAIRDPDLAVFNAGVTTQGRTASEALAANSTAMERVIAALRRSGVADRDIQTSNLSISPVYADPNRDAMMASRMSGQPYVPPPPEQRVPQIIGYQANNNVAVRQRDLKKFGAVIDTLAEAGANQINGPMFQLDNADPALDQARLDAVRAARARAELYAGAAGLRIVRILSISETGGYYGPPAVHFAQAITVTGSAPPPPPSPVHPGELQMTASVTMLFELAPR